MINIFITFYIIFDILNEWNNFFLEVRYILNISKMYTYTLDSILQSFEFEIRRIRNRDMSQKYFLRGSFRWFTYSIEFKVIRISELQNFEYHFGIL